MPHTRHTDPQTSHDAADSVDALTQKQDAVLQCFRQHGPMTDHVLIACYPPHRPRQSVSGLRTRRSELVQRGCVEDTGERVVLPSGRKAIVWQAVQHDVMARRDG